ncbi:MAG: hypothetical protein K2I93_04540 [Oscillospiraceae bacterium]|nr:hypothetical protein [Oscillospiraceae bacterium]
MEKFDANPYCEGAIKFALQFGKKFSYKYEDIKDMEEILEILHCDYQSKKLTDEMVESISVSLGIYLGQVMLENKLYECGYQWNTEGDGLCLAKNDKNKMFPISKVWKRITNGIEDSVKSFYDIGIVIAERGIPKKGC